MWTMNTVAASSGQLRIQLAAGIHPPDIAFDRFLPEDLRSHSDIHWTPLSVASRVARWLDGLGADRVVDLGSGVGKFCIAAALAGRCRYVGIEQRPRLVEVARGLARDLGVEDRVQFLQGDVGEMSIPAADAYYLYNPFGENLLRPEQHLDGAVELCEERHARDVASLTRFIEELPPGTLVVTYHGFGGEMPSTLIEMRFIRSRRGLLRLWRKDSP